MSKLLCRNSLLRTAKLLSHHQPLVLILVRCAPRMSGVNVCFEHAVIHSLRIQRPLLSQGLTKSGSRLMP